MNKDPITVLREALDAIASIEDKMNGGDWEEIDEARKIARVALATAPAAIQPAGEADEIAVRKKIVQELLSSAFLHCDVNKEHVLLALEYGGPKWHKYVPEAKAEQVAAPDAPVHYDGVQADAWGDGWMAGYEAAAPAVKHEALKTSHPNECACDSCVNPLL